jgi:Skp family chaperone for outer membrane proteins
MPAVAQAPAAAAAGSIPAPVIAVVDVDRILRETAGAKSVDAQATKYKQSFQAELSKEESALRATQQELEQERKTMAQDVFAEKARAFQERAGAFQRKNALIQRAFDVSMNTALGKVRQAMLDAAQNVAATRGATVVLPSGQIIMFDPKMNITSEIIAEMDKKLQNVEFPPPKVEGEPASTAPAPAAGGKKKTR